MIEAQRPRTRPTRAAGRPCFGAVLSVLAIVGSTAGTMAQDASPSAAASPAASGGYTLPAGAPICGTEPVTMKAYFETGFPMPKA